jgi:energy-coupling factor transporter ATP-binding protein EcfA2
MFSRIRQVQLAILLPIGFLLARVIYAVLFGGARSGEVLLLDLPTFALAGPFAHISILGPVYLDGLLANLSTALPFALFMLATGLSVLFFKPKNLFELAKKLPAFSALISALAIGWVQLPALIQATNRINRSTKLRKEKRVRALLPILETAIGTSLAIGQRMVLANKTPGSKYLELKITDLAVEQAGLREINLGLSPGECMVVSGPTGSGKSSLLLAATGMAGQLGLAVSGEIQTPQVVGYLPQQAREQLFGPLVKDEIAPTNIFGLFSKMDLPVHQLSEGEAIQVSVVRELQKQPLLLILDEPFAGLDADATSELVELLANYLSVGGSLLVAEHRPELLASIATSTAHLAEGKLVAGNWKPSQTEAARKPALLAQDLVLSFQAPSIGYGDKTLITEPRLEVRQSAVIAITGRNAVGKTSLLNAIEIKSMDVAMVPELVSDFFVTTSLAAELARADHIAKVEAGFTRANLESILGELPELETHPRDLSAGTQSALAIAMQLSHKPRILLIDEPAKGFDPQTKAQVVATLECVRETGCAVVFATHDYGLIEQLGATVFEISNAQLIKVGQVMA